MFIGFIWHASFLTTTKVSQAFQSLTLCAKVAKHNQITDFTTALELTTYWKDAEASNTNQKTHQTKQECPMDCDVVRVPHRYTMGRVFPHCTCTHIHHNPSWVAPVPNHKLHGIKQNLWFLLDKSILI